MSKEELLNRVRDDLDHIEDDRFLHLPQDFVLRLAWLESQLKSEFPTFIEDSKI